MKSLLGGFNAKVQTVCREDVFREKCAMRVYMKLVMIMGLR
jgi:hypothetical protein